MKTNVDDINFKYMAYLKKREDEITCIISEIQQNMSDMKRLLDSYDVCHVCSYKSKIAVFRKLPPKLTVCLPKFIPHQIDEAEINQQLGVVLKLKVITREYDPSFISKEVIPFLPKRPLMTNPIAMTYIVTESGNNQLCYVSCVSNTEIWTSGCDEFLRLYNLEGKLVKFIKTKSGKVPIAIAIIRFDDLIYADNYDRSLNIVKGTEVHTMIRLQEWRPIGVCSSSSDELLLLMVNDSYNQKKLCVIPDLQKNKPFNSTTKANLFFRPPVIIFQHSSVRTKTLIFVWRTITQMQLWWSIKVGNSDLDILQSIDYFDQSELLQTAKIGC